MLLGEKQGSTIAARDTGQEGCSNVNLLMLKSRRLLISKCSNIQELNRILTFYKKKLDNMISA
jgi:hypothetical protein